MRYYVEFTSEATGKFLSLDKVVSQRVLDKLKWLSHNFDDLTPEVLTGELKGFYKLRVGSYRVIYTVNHDKSLLTVYLIGHRRNIYKR